MHVTAPSGSYITPRFEHATAADAMRPRVMACSPETPLVTAAQRMAGEHVHALVVQRWEPHDGAARRPCAVLTDFDVLRHADRAEELTAGDAASECPLTVLPTDRLPEVAAAKVRSGVTHAIVTEAASGRPVGVVSTLDIAGIVGWGRA